MEHVIPSIYFYDVCVSPTLYQSNIEAFLLEEKDCSFEVAEIESLLKINKKSHCPSRLVLYISGRGITASSVGGSINVFSDMGVEAFPFAEALTLGTIPRSFWRCRKYLIPPA
jgi:hypothetical protein